MSIWFNKAIVLLDYDDALERVTLISIHIILTAKVSNMYNQEVDLRSREFETRIPMKCRYCNYEWWSITGNPKVCPRCKKRFDIQETTKELEMKKCCYCNYEWLSRLKSPKACPRCHRRLDYPTNKLV